MAVAHATCLILSNTSHNVYTLANFGDLHWTSHLTSAEAAAVCGVTLKTFLRWLRKQRPAPFYAFKIVEVIGHGSLGGLHPTWKGWSICRRGFLHSPYSARLTPGEVEALWYSLPRLREFQRGRPASAPPTPTGHVQIDHPRPLEGGSLHASEIRRSDTVQ